MRQSPLSSKVYKYSYLPNGSQVATGLVIREYESTFGRFKTHNPCRMVTFEGKTQMKPYYWNGSPTGDYHGGPIEVSFNTAQFDDLRRKCYSVASSKFLNKMKEQDFDLGIFLGEYAETSKYIREKIKPLANAMRAYRNRDMAELWRSLGINRRKRRRIQRTAKRKSLGDSAIARDLEFKFAVMPIVSDVHALANLQMDVHPSWTVGSSHGDHSQYLIKYGTDGFDPEVFSYRNYMKSRVIGQISIKNFFTYTLSQFGMTDPALTFYQVLPLSFMYDFFVPIGKWASQFSALDGLNLDQCSVTTRAVNEMDYECIHRKRWNRDAAVSTSQCREKRYWRETNFKPSVDFPTWKNNQVPFEADKLFTFVELCKQIALGKSK